MKLHLLRLSKSKRGRGRDQGRGVGKARRGDKKSGFATWNLMKKKVTRLTNRKKNTRTKGKVNRAVKSRQGR